MRRLLCKIIKTNTNDSELCKIYIEIVTHDDLNQPVIIINKMVLTKHDYYKKLGFVAIKKFKDMELIYQCFSSKFTTFNNIVNVLNTFNYE